MTSHPFVQAAIRLSVLLVCAASCAAHAQSKPAPDQAVIVTAMRDPVDKSYRSMIKGMDLFEKLHAMAPDASLRYKLLPRQRDTNMTGISTKTTLVAALGQTTSIAFITKTRIRAAPAPQMPR